MDYMLGERIYFKILKIYFKNRMCSFTPKMFVPIVPVVPDQSCRFSFHCGVRLMVVSFCGGVHGSFQHYKSYLASRDEIILNLQ